MTSTHDSDLLLGRLAIHFELLTKDQVAEALRRRRDSETAYDLGTFLVMEDYLTVEQLQKLQGAKERYLEKRQGSREVATQEPAPAAAEDSGDDTRPAVEDSGEDTRPAAEEAGEDLNKTRPGVWTDLTGAEVAAAGDDTRPAIFEEAPAAAEGVAGDLEAADPGVRTSAETAAGAQISSAPIAAEPEPEVPGVEIPIAEGVTDETEAAEPRIEEASTGEVDELLSFGPGTGLEALLQQTAARGASDLHLHSGARLRLREGGRLRESAGPELQAEDVERLLRGLLSEEQHARLAAERQLDFAFALPGVGRFRANAYYQLRGPDAVFRSIPLDPPSFEDLGLPSTFQALTGFHQGIVLLTGPAGCGKSSTMAALVHRINEERPDHIVTVEDPIEFVHPSRRSVVNQRQVGPHTESFARALRAALREDPDVIVIGELRDLETISLALTAAETGHLVLATLHTSSAVRTINRVLGVFPPDQQAQIRTMVSESLRAIVSQRLVRRADGRGRVPALEVMINTKAAGNLIRDNKTFQIQSIMQTGTGQGMCLLDVSLAELVRSGTITREEALRHAEDPKRFA